MSATDRINLVFERINNAAQRAGRSPQEITLVAVTKTIPLERILPYLEAGVHHIGENRVQEALAKFQNPDGSKSVRASLHLIGQLQSNKAKKAAALFDQVQSLDRLDLADDLNRHAQALGKVLPCLIEVKISPEDSKSGVAPEALEGLLGQLKSRTSLSIEGLMGIAPQDTAGDAARPYFAKLRRLCEDSKLKVLSMGMSSDFEAAIAEGSTMIRLGSVLFGPRA